MDEPIIYELKKLPDITLDKNKLYMLDNMTFDKDDIGSFISQTTIDLLQNNTHFVSFIWKPTQTSIYDINKYSVVKTFITCYNVSVGNRIILTEVDYNKYKYKQFNNEKRVYITELYTNVQIKSCNNFNIIVNDEDHDLLYIYITENKPEAETYASTLENKSNIIYKPIDITSVVDISSNENLTYDFFNELLYMNNINTSILTETLRINIDKGYIIKLFCNKTVDLNESNLIKHIECVYNNKVDLNNRFINRRELKNVLDKNLCAYIISNIKQFTNDDTNKELNKLSTIYEPMSFIIHTVILPEFAKCYNIPIDDYVINAANVKIIRDIETDDNNILKNNNKLKGIMAMDIMLSPNVDCVGFSRRFNDDTSITMSTGDAIIYNPRLLTDTKYIKGKLCLLSFEIEVISLLRMKSAVY
jgi:hypothetical protein